MGSRVAAPGIIGIAQAPRHPPRPHCLDAFCFLGTVSACLQIFQKNFVVIQPRINQGTTNPPKPPENL